MSAALRVEGITKTFGSLKAVDDVSFEVEAGQICGFIGPNGAGKTTSMRIVATLELPDKGDVLIEGLSVLEEPRKVRRKIGFMPDSYGAYSNTTVDDYLDCFARAYGLRGKHRKDSVQQVMDFTSLNDLSCKEMSALSKGMKQRLCLAKTLLPDPTVLILDEPAAGLDPRARVELRELVKTLAELGKAVLISSHILSELSEMCHGVTVIESGKIQATGSVSDITQELTPHAQVFVRGLAPAEHVQRALLEQPRVSEVRLERSGAVFTFEGDPEQLAELLAALVRADLKLVEFAPEEIDLEDIFLTLTEGRVQ